MWPFKKTIPESARPPKPADFPDADQKWRLVRTATQPNYGPQGYVMGSKVAEPDSWWLEYYREPYWSDSEKRWYGPYWYECCLVVGKDRALEALRIKKSPQEILYG